MTEKEVRGAVKKENADLGTFSDFLLHAPENQREEVLKEAARLANEEQRKVFEQSRVRSRSA